MFRTGLEISFLEFKGEIKTEKISELTKEVDRRDKLIKTYDEFFTEVSENQKKPNYNSSNIEELSNLTLEDFRRILQGTRLEGLEYAYLYAEEKYGINAIFLYALTVHESAHGTSRLAREKNNLTGFGAFDSDPFNSAFTFESFSACVLHTAKALRTHYIDNGLTSTQRINSRYATDTEWFIKINAIANRALRSIEN